MLASERENDNVISERELNEFFVRLNGLQVGGRRTSLDEAALRLAFKNSEDHSPVDLLEITQSYLSNKSQEEAAVEV